MFSCVQFRSVQGAVCSALSCQLLSQSCRLGVSAVLRVRASARARASLDLLAAAAAAVACWWSRCHSSSRSHLHLPRLPFRPSTLGPWHRKTRLKEHSSPYSVHETRGASRLPVFTRPTRVFGVSSEVRISIIQASLLAAAETLKVPNMALPRSDFSRGTTVNNLTKTR